MGKFSDEYVRLIPSDTLSVHLFGTLCFFVDWLLSVWCLCSCVRVLRDTHLCWCISCLSGNVDIVCRWFPSTVLGFVICWITLTLLIPLVWVSCVCVTTQFGPCWCSRQAACSHLWRTSSGLGMTCHEPCEVSRTGGKSRRMFSKEAKWDNSDFVGETVVKAGETGSLMNSCCCNWTVSSGSASKMVPTAQPRLHKWRGTLRQCTTQHSEDDNKSWSSWRVCWRQASPAPRASQQIACGLQTREEADRRVFNMEGIVKITTPGRN